MQFHKVFLGWFGLYLTVYQSQVQATSPCTPGAVDPPGTVHNITDPTQPKTCAASVCFGLESSNALNAYQFDKQKRFFTALLENLSHRSAVEVAAVQYASANEVLFELTSDVGQAARNVSGLSQTGDPFSSPSSPIVYCDAVLREKEGANRKLVLFSTGEQDLGGDPVIRADVFRERAGGEVIVIGVGNRNGDLLKALVGDMAANLFSLFFEDRSGSTDRVANAICTSGR